MRLSEANSSTWPVCDARVDHESFDEQYGSIDGLSGRPPALIPGAAVMTPQVADAVGKAKAASQTAFLSNRRQVGLGRGYREGYERS